VLASPQRIEILDYLAQAPRSVDDISQLTGLTPANASRHLQILKNLFMVKVETQGRLRIYHLAGDDVIHLLQALRFTAEKHLGQIQQLLEQYPDADSEVRPMSIEELKAAIEKDEVIVLDVRPENEYQAGHIPDAINIPPGQLDKILESLPKETLKDKTVVAYCRGPYCVYSYEAAQKLKQNHIRVRRLEDGLPQWRAKGYETVSEQAVQPYATSSTIQNSIKKESSKVPKPPVLPPGMLEQ